MQQLCYLQRANKKWKVKTKCTDFIAIQKNNRPYKSAIPNHYLTTGHRVLNFNLTIFKSIIKHKHLNAWEIYNISKTTLVNNEDGPLLSFSFTMKQFNKKVYIVRLFSL